MFLINKDILNGLEKDGVIKSNNDLLDDIVNGMYFKPLKESVVGENEVEIKIALSVREVNGNRIYRFDKDVYLETPVFYDPFNKNVDKYLLFLHSIKHLLICNFDISNMEVILEGTCVYPPKYLYCEGEVIYLLFNLYIYDDFIKDFKCKIENSDLVDIKDIKSEGKLNKLILENQGIVKNFRV